MRPVIFGLALMLGGCATAPHTTASLPASTIVAGDSFDATAVIAARALRTAVCQYVKNKYRSQSSYCIMSVMRGSYAKTWKVYVRR